MKQRDAVYVRQASMQDRFKICLLCGFKRRYYIE